MNFDCRRVTDLLVEIVDGTASDELKSEVQRHLCGCVPCAIYMHTYSDTIRLTRKLPDVEMPAEFACRLMAVIDDECKASRTRLDTAPRS